ncbi:MAG: DUF3750 domain-containing protein [Betaproteobacteria bacterium]|nr:DUF3750 domain-containing protein [Betaproteobacteria bacterium]
MKGLRRGLKIAGAGFALGAVVLMLAAGGVSGHEDWRTASREPVGLAPDPALNSEAIVQVYGARAVRWRGYFGIHTWIAVKSKAAKHYTVYEVIGWRLRWSDSALVIRERAPDGRWFGNAPELLAEKRGDGVDALIARIDQAARTYPHAGEYSVWPGPNSNTFTAWVARAVPELELDLPATAIGKDYLADSVFAKAPSGSGMQFSLFGLLGLIVSDVEGLEVNVLGLTFGLNPFAPAIKLPLLGRVGPVRINGAVAAENAS